jgi:cytochrome b
MANDKRTVKVWDPVIRIGHWTLVVAFFTAYFTEDDFLSMHVLSGYVVCGVIVLRVFLGFVGNQYARFSNFVYSPAKILSYLKGVIARQPQHYVGHNPAGGAMVIALLLGLTASTVTGLKLYAVEENAGPFAMIFQQVNSSTLPQGPSSSAIQVNDDEQSPLNQSNSKVDKKAEEFWEEMHEIFANLTLFLVLIHIAGVVFSGIVDREKLIKAMITGIKEIDDTYQ